MIDLALQLARHYASGGVAQPSSYMDAGYAPEIDEDQLSPVERLLRWMRGPEQTRYADIWSKQYGVPRPEETAIDAINMSNAYSAAGHALSPRGVLGIAERSKIHHGADDFMRAADGNSIGARELERDFLSDMGPLARLRYYLSDFKGVPGPLQPHHLATQAAAISAADTASQAAGGPQLGVGPFNWNAPGTFQRALRDGPERDSRTNYRLTFDGIPYAGVRPHVPMPKYSTSIPDFE